MKLKFLNNPQNQRMLYSLLRRLSNNPKSRNIVISKSEFDTINKHKSEIAAFLDFPFNWEITIIKEFSNYTKKFYYSLRIKIV